MGHPEPTMNSSHHQEIPGFEDFPPSNIIDSRRRAIKVCPSAEKLEESFTSTEVKLVKIQRRAPFYDWRPHCRCSLFMRRCRTCVSHPKLTTRQIQIALIRGGIESNPGPPKSVPVSGGKQQPAKKQPRFNKSQGKVKDTIEAAKDAVAQTTGNPRVERAKTDKELSVLLRDKLQADLAILDSNAHLEHHEPELRARLTRELELLKLSDEIETLKLKRQLCDQGVELLKAELEKQNLEHQLKLGQLHAGQETLANLKLVAELAEFEDSRTVLEEREAKLLEKEKGWELDAREESKRVAEIFTVNRTTPFFKNFDMLGEGVPCSGMSMFLPAQFRAMNRSFKIAGTGSGLSSYVDCGDVDAEDVKGWEQSLLICELPWQQVGMAVEKTWKVSAAMSTTGALTGALVRNQSIATASKILAATSLMAGVVHTAINLASHIKGAKLRAMVLESLNTEDFADTRPREDVIAAGAKLHDRLLRIRLFVELTLLDGATVLCFDPVAMRLFNWTKSSFYMMGCLATDDNKKFRDFWISEHQYLTTVSRHSLVVSEFEKSKAVSRIHKLLEMTPAFDEQHEIRFLTGEGIYTATLRFATLVVTKDPYRNPSDF